MEDNQTIESGRRKQWTRMVKSPGHFLKHADRDPDGLMRFHVELPEIYLLDACRMYRQLTGKLPHFAFIFESWFFQKYPDVLDDPGARRFYLGMREKVSFTKRPEFYAEMRRKFKLVRYINNRRDPSAFLKST